jgi:purine-binding chemotaxis protein CheW
MTIDHDKESTEHPQYLTFFIAGEEHAIGILRVREIIQFAGVTRVPRTPDWVRGVINLRGSVVPVVDLAVKFGWRALQPTRLSCVVVAEVSLDGEPVVMGLLADAVSGVVELPAAEIQPPPPFGPRVRVEYLHGMGRVGERLLLLLDVDKLLSVDELQTAATIEAEAVAEAQPAPQQAPAA